MQEEITNMEHNVIDKPIDKPGKLYSYFLVFKKKNMQLAIPINVYIYIVF